MNIDIHSLDEPTRTILREYGFDPKLFFELVQRLKTGGLSAEGNRLPGPIELPAEESYVPLPEPDSDQARHLAAIGQTAIDAGQVGVVVLNGGMATRFGGLAKGATEAVTGRSFLDLKLSQVAKAGRGRAPVLLMNSFATDDATKEHLARLKINCDVQTFCQLVSLRCTPRGELFLDRRGKPSLYAPGHGDLPFALKESELLRHDLGQGIRYHLELPLHKAFYIAPLLPR